MKLSNDMEKDSGNQNVSKLPTCSYSVATVIKWVPGSQQDACP